MAVSNIKARIPYKRWEFDMEKNFYETFCKILSEKTADSICRRSEKSSIEFSRGVKWNTK